MRVSKAVRTAVRAVLLCAAAVCGLLLCGCSSDVTENEMPENITLYIKDESRIVTLSFRDYLTGCIFAAASPSFQRETLLATGIACAGQALYCMENADRSDIFGADLSSDPEYFPEWTSPEVLKEEYGGDYEDYLEKVSDIAGEAAAICPRYDGKPANTLFCRISTGLTDDGGEPYLPSLALPGDKESRGYSGSCVLTEEIVRRSIIDHAGSVILPPDSAKWFTGAEYTEGGTLRKISFGGMELTGKQLCAALELRSTAITIEQSYGSFTFKTCGVGNNTGMSICAAEKLARSGSSAEEILEFFYPGVELVRAK